MKHVSSDNSLRAFHLLVIWLLGGLGGSALLLLDHILLSGIPALIAFGAIVLLLFLIPKFLTSFVEARVRLNVETHTAARINVISALLFGLTMLGISVAEGMLSSSVVTKICCLVIAPAGITLIIFHLIRESLRADR